MPSYFPATKGDEFVFGLCLTARDGSGIQSNPTLAAGDVRISKDGGAFANLATLPTVNPTSDVRVEVTLSATEMDADNIMVVFSDASGGQWGDDWVQIQTVSANFDDIAFALNTVSTNVSTILTQLSISATLLSSIITNIGVVDTVVDAIKVKTDELTFTVSGQVDANAESMNGTEILGNGSAGNLWRGP